MKDLYKIVISLVVGLILGAGAISVLPEGYGATTRFSGITVGSDGLVVNGSATLATSTLGRVTSGGTVLALSYGSTTPSATLTQAQIQYNSYITVASASTTGGITLTLPATSTLTAFIPTVGQKADLYLTNATSSATTTVTIAAGAGMTIDNATSTLVIRAGQTAALTFIREVSSDVRVLFNIFN